MRIERGVEREPAYFINEQKSRTNYDYIFGAHGDFLKERLFYTLGMDVMRYQLIGDGISPHAGLGFYALRPRSGIFSGTRLNFSFSQGIREPKLTEEIGSLYDFLSLTRRTGDHSTTCISPRSRGRPPAPGRAAVSRPSGASTSSSAQATSTTSSAAPSRVLARDSYPTLLPNLTPAAAKPVAECSQQ